MASGKRLRDEDIPTLLDSVINETNSDYSESEEDIFGDDDSESNSDASDSEPPRPTVAATAGGWSDVSNKLTSDQLRPFLQTPPRHSLRN